MAASLRFIVDGAYGCCSSAIRYRVTTVLLKASLGSEQYQSMTSRMAWSYERFELVEVRLFTTAVLDCSRSGSLKDSFRGSFTFALRHRERPPVAAAKSMIQVLDLLTSRAFLVPAKIAARKSVGRFGRYTAR
jgi:hypothetical protein